MLILAMLAMSLDVLLGYTGLPSLGHAGIFGVAAYAVAVLSTTYQRRASGRPWPAASWSGTLLSALFGLFVSHVRDVYFLMITLAIGMVLWGISYRWIPMTGGDNGISGIPRLEAHVGSAGRRARSPSTTWRCSCSPCAVSCWRCSCARPFGLTLRGHPRKRIADAEPRVQHLAALLSELRHRRCVRQRRRRVWAYYNGFVSPTYLDLTASSELFLMVTLGGPGTLRRPGARRGAIVLLKNVISAYTQRWLLILGIVYIVTILVAPQGLWNLGVGREVRLKAGRYGGSRLIRERPIFRRTIDCVVCVERCVRVVTAAFCIVRLAASGAADGPIKIGFMAPLSGPYAQNGRDILNGFLLYLDEIGYRAARTPDPADRRGR